MKATWNRKYTIWCEYVYNTRCQLEEDIHNLQSRLRFRRPTIEDCIELILAIDRLEAYNEFVSHTRSILTLENIVKRNDL